jgi:hypothetical protein
MQDAAAIGRRHASPIAGQCRPGCLHRALDVLAAAAGNVGKMRTVRWIQDLETTSIGGIDRAESGMSCEAGAENRWIAGPALPSTPKSMAAPPSTSTIIRNSTIRNPKRCTSARSWDAAASESVAMALKTTDEARHAADDIC